MRQMADIMGASGVDSEELIEESGGRAPSDVEEPMFSGPGPDGIDIGDTSVLSSQSKAEPATRSPTGSAGSDTASIKVSKEVKRPANIAVNESGASCTTTNSLQSPTKLQGDKHARTKQKKLADLVSPLPSPGISSIKSRDSLRAAASTMMGPGDSIGAGDSNIILKVLESPLSEDAFALLKEEVEWQEMHHRGGKVPRLVAVQGEIGADGGVPVYRHPADESPPLLQYSPTVQKIRKQVEKAVGQTLNHALIQLYRDGVDNISEHSDKVFSSTVDNVIRAQLTYRPSMLYEARASSTSVSAHNES